MTTKTLTAKVLCIATALVAPVAGTAFAAVPASTQIIARNAHGRATEVRVNGQDYKVCQGAVQDECINPRQAGLHFGDAPMKHWPGKAVSER